MQQARELATVRNYRDLIAVLRARSDEKHLTREAMDVGAKLHLGYSAKLLTETTIKGFGPLTLGPVLGMLGLELVVRERSTQR